jgi:two-component system response regulator YesN
MVVDDEPLIRQGLTSLVDWKGLGCELVREAENGREAFERLKEQKVDLVICDIRMPEMNGLDFAKAVYEAGLDTKIILLTAFPTFAYAQTALRYHVADYVVKSNYIETLPDAVKSVTARIGRAKRESERLEQLKGRIDSGLAELREKLFFDLFTGALHDDPAIQEKIERSGFPGGPYCVTVFKAGAASAEGLEGAGLARFLRSVRNFLTLAYCRYETVTVVADSRTLATVIACPQSGGAEPGAVLGISRDILKTVRESLNFHASVGVSRLYAEASELRGAYREACEEVEWAVFFGTDTVCLAGGRDMSAAPYADDRARLQEASELLNEYSDRAARAWVGQIVGDARKQRVPVARLKELSLMIASVCLKTAAERSAPGESRAALPPLAAFQESVSVSELTQLLLDMLARTDDALRSRARQYNHYVREALQYIQTHYAQDINLASIADMLHVNRNYLGSLYKKETGETVSAALNRCRIEKAVEMLRNPAVLISDVAERVGFCDPAYFTNLFTKHMGLSPKAYRNKSV